mgnify:CR=1 FL=1
MKKAERYVFPAVFTYEPDQEIAVVFPDLDAATSGTDDNDALLSARELLDLNLSPDCRSILSSVLRGMSLSGCFTVVRPFFVGCLNW